MCAENSQAVNLSSSGKLSCGDFRDFDERIEGGMDGGMVKGMGRKMDRGMEGEMDGWMDG